VRNNLNVNFAVAAFQQIGCCARDVAAEVIEGVTLDVKQCARAVFL
jgi:hypothetical protein